MHIGILIDPSPCYYLPTFQVSLRLAENDEVIEGERPRRAIFTKKISQALRVVTHAERGKGAL